VCEVAFIVFVMFIGNCAVTVVDFVVYNYVSSASFITTD
jgi:hypothetical protein